MAKMTRSEAGKLGAIKAHKIQLEQKNKRIATYNTNPILCKNCEKPLSYDEKVRKKVFCSHSCSAFYNNIRRAKTRPQCAVCESICKTVNSTYCSTKCQQKYRMLEKIENKTASFLTIKRYLKDKDYRCSICGLSEWLNKPILLIGDHIDGNSSNNLLENLRLVCSNCDATLETYKSRNRGYGRAYRRERYGTGLSY